MPSQRRTGWFIYNLWIGTVSVFYFRAPRIHILFPTNTKFIQFIRRYMQQSALDQQSKWISARILATPRVTKWMFALLLIADIAFIRTQSLVWWKSRTFFRIGRMNEGKEEDWQKDLSDLRGEIVVLLLCQTRLLFIHKCYVQFQFRVIRHKQTDKFSAWRQQSCQ